MTHKEIVETLAFPEGLDQAIIDKFGDVNPKSVYNVFTDSYATSFEAGPEISNEIDIFIEGFMLGNQELSNRLLK